jgi:hypothetical protein
MTNQAFNALCYELAMWAANKRPSLRLQPWFVIARQLVQARLDCMENRANH